MNATTNVRQAIRCVDCSKRDALVRAAFWADQNDPVPDVDEPMTMDEVLLVTGQRCPHLDVADDNDSTLEDVGNRLGLSRERVRQVEMVIMAKLRRDSRMRRLGGVDHTPRPSRLSVAGVAASNWRQDGPRHTTQPKNRVGVVAVERRETILAAIAEDPQTHAQLAALLGCSEKSVRNVVNRLVVTGLVIKRSVERTGKGRGPSVLFEMPGEARARQAGVEQATARRVPGGNGPVAHGKAPCARFRIRVTPVDVQSGRMAM